MTFRLGIDLIFITDICAENGRVYAEDLKFPYSGGKWTTLEEIRATGWEQVC